MNLTGVTRPIIADLFCGAGGAAMGYYRAGFDVIGIDNCYQPRYPFTFVRGDALKTVFRRAVAIHASPPCKTQTVMSHFSHPWHEDLIPQTRELLDASGLPYVIENVVGAKLINPITLCGSMFDLGVRRHRLFEMGRWKMHQPMCNHERQNATSPMYKVKRYHSGKPVITPSPVIGVYGRGQGLGPGEVNMWRKAMGIDWMVRDELSQAIPPAYTEMIGRELMSVLA